MNKIYQKKTRINPRMIENIKRLICAMFLMFPLILFVTVRLSRHEFVKLLMEIIQMVTLGAGIIAFILGLWLFFDLR